MMNRIVQVQDIRLSKSRFNSHRIYNREFIWV